MKRTLAVFFAFCVIISPAGVFEARAVEAVPTPLIINDGGVGVFDSVPELRGLTAAGTEVMVYLDGTYAGMARVEGAGTETDSFSFRNEREIGGGRHTFMAIARDPLSLVLSAPSSEYVFEIVPLPAPTLVMPDISTVTAKPRPPVAGLTKSGTKVQVWIDGIYNGETAYVEHPSGTADFSYRPFLDLGVGQHFIALRSVDRQGRRSEFTVQQEFRIEEPMPSPARMGVYFKNQSLGSPLITGVARSGSKVRVFIDGRLNGEIAPREHASGAVGFVYRPYLPLVSGPHTAYAVAVDGRGKESRWSEIVSFRVFSRDESDMAGEVPVSEGPGPETPETAIIPGGLLDGPDEGGGPVVAIDGSETKPAEEEGAVSVPDAGTEEGSDGDKGESDEIKDILDKFQGEEATTSGIVDESNAEQGRLKWNLVVFIVFLLAVIGWIFWVNRELAREKAREAGAQDNKNEKGKK